MITILATWLALFLGLVGIGSGAFALLARLPGCGTAGRSDPFRRFWFGCGTTIAAAQLWSLLAPLDAAALTAWLLAAGGGLLLLLPRPWPAVRREWRWRPGTRRLAGWALLAAAGLYLLYLGATWVATPRWSRVYDTDLYHFNILRWMNTYAAVPGLGNLHSRLAHTSGFLVLAALFDNLWWDRATAWLLYGLIVSVASMQWLWTIMSPPEGAGRRPRLFCLLTFPYLARLQTSIHPTLYHDEIAFVVQLVLLLEALRFLPGRLGERASGAERPVVDLPGFMMLTLLGTLCFSIKPSGAVALLFTACVAAGVVAALRWRQRLPLRRVASLAAAAGLVPLLLLAGHAARNVVQTGWLAFPAPLGRVAVDWAMPGEPADDTHAERMQSVRGQYEVIKAWARMPGAADYRKALHGGLAVWLPGWRARSWKGIERHVFYLGLLFWLLHLLGMGRGRADAAAVRGDFALLLLVGANLLFWFHSAPDMRFGRAFFWIWMGAGGSLLFSRPRLPAGLAGLAAGLLAAGALLSMSLPLAPRRPASWRGVGRAGPRRTAAVTIPNGQVPPLTVQVPLKGDRCGDSPLPATPYPLPTLLMREPGRLQSGFRRAR
ncbi:MAG: hypothetical protein GX571_05400 [Lentisphaerae bacterium]|nr:hypothetical protein [Lentisphaerota bacterium]